MVRDRLAQRVSCLTHRGQAGRSALSDVGVRRMVRPAGLAVRASLTGGPNGRSSGSELAPKDKSERIRLIARWGARRTSHLGPVLLRHLRFEVGRRSWARGTVLMTFVSGVHNTKI